MTPRRRRVTFPNAGAGQRVIGDTAATNGVETDVTHSPGDSEWTEVCGCRTRVSGKECQVLHSDWWPEPGFARREAKSLLVSAFYEEGGPRGKYGFPREASESEALCHVDFDHVRRARQVHRGAGRDHDEVALCD
jgi:hypothetical protein